MQHTSTFAARTVLIASLATFGAAQEARVYDTQATPAPTSTAGPAAARTSEDKSAFKQEELDQILAPIALYPDTLVSQLLMACTYPLEIVQADRWVKAHKELKGDAAAKALETEGWDPSVKSLVNFPDVLSMLSEKLDWTQKLGDAFIGQREDVMRTIQQLRGKAKSEGKLDSNENQKVEVSQEGTTQYITIESANPDVVYVPVYDPVVVYGTWPYPAYPPYPYYPPAYGVGMGIAVGFAWGYAWGSCNWGHSDVDIDIDRNVNRNTNIDRSKYKKDAGGRGSGKFQHNPQHRQGVPYRNDAAANRYGGRTTAQTAQARESYRGRGGAESPNRSGAGSAGDLSRAGAGDAGAASRGGGNRATGALDGVNRGGQSARASSSRGRASRGGGGGRGGGGRR